MQKTKKMKFLKSKYFKIAISTLFSIFCVFLILKIVDFKIFFENIKTLDYKFLIFAVLAILSSYFFRIFRYEQILDIKNQRLKLFGVSTIHYFLNKIMPARTGEISLPVLLKNNFNVDYKIGVAALFFFRILDFFAMIFLLLISSFFVEIQQINPVYIIGFSVLALLGITVFWIFLDSFMKIAVRLFEKFNIQKLEKLKIKIIELFQFIENFKKQKKIKFLLKVVVISLLNWISIYFYYFFVIKSFGFEQNYLQTVFATSVSNFTFVIPISSIGNIGPFEGGWAIGFYLIGVSKDISVPIGFFSNIFATLLTALLAGLGYFLLKVKK